MNELHLFAGAGGGILAGQLLGHRTVCAVEFEPYAQAVLVARQNDGSLPPFPIWDDVIQSCYEKSIHLWKSQRVPCLQQKFSGERFGHCILLCQILFARLSK